MAPRVAARPAAVECKAALKVAALPAAVECKVVAPKAAALPAVECRAAVLQAAVAPRAVPALKVAAPRVAVAGSRRPGAEPPVVVAAVRAVER